MSIAEESVVNQPLAIHHVRRRRWSAPVAAPSRPMLVFLRGIVWGLIGLIYAPLFIGLAAILERLGAGASAYAVAAALAGAAGAVLYGSHELALLATTIGAVVGVLLLIGAADLLSFAQCVAVAAGLAALVGLVVPFPGQCTRQVPAKAMAGLSSGAVCGLVLVLAQTVSTAPIPLYAILAFLVAVNGALYVGTVRRWIGLAARLRGPTTPCRLIESLVLATLAGLAAGSVWLMAGPLLGESSGLVGAVGTAIYAGLPQAATGGILGGVVAGALLEAYGLAWVHDV
jgi:hypothetical protein